MKRAIAASVVGQHAGAERQRASRHATEIGADGRLGLACRRRDGRRRSHCAGRVAAPAAGDARGGTPPARRARPSKSAGSIATAGNAIRACDVPQNSAQWPRIACRAWWRAARGGWCGRESCPSCRRATGSRRNGSRRRCRARTRRARRPAAGSRWRRRRVLPSGR